MRRYCYTCGKEIDSELGSSKRFCSSECELAHIKELGREREKRWLKGKSV